ncbi:MAG: hypothetical protein WCK53_16055, partial [Methanomicrobiales archaeon]
LAGQVALLIQYKKPLDSTIGFISFFPLVPHIMRERRRTRSKITLSTKEIEQLLVLSPVGVPLPGWVSGKKREI